MKTAKDFILKHWNPEVIPGECDVKHFFDEMDRVMQLYSDQQNKELRQDLEQLMKSINKNFYVAEIQRLTKEVEEYKKELAIERDDNEDLRRLRDSFRTALNERNVENTRLRELLGKCRSMVRNEVDGWGSWEERIKILTEINQTLNPDQIEKEK